MKKKRTACSAASSASLWQHLRWRDAAEERREKIGDRNAEQGSSYGADSGEAGER